MGKLLQTWDRVRDHLGFDLLGGPRPLKAAWVINLQKGGTLAFVLLLMWRYDCWTPTAWTYAALHGSYGLAWLLKDRVSPDPGWERRVTFPSAVMMWALVLGPYWIAPVLIVTQRIEQPTWLLGVATIVYVMGVLIMMGSDGQKYFTLKVKKGLVTTGFFARIRHPNYLGEMMLYGTFAALSGHWIPWAVLAWVWLGVFVPNILRKEASMSRYPEWAAYKARTGYVLPRLFVASADVGSATGATGAAGAGE